MITSKRTPSDTDPGLRLHWSPLRGGNPVRDTPESLRMSERAGGQAPMFSVVMTTHNRPQFLEDAIASVVAQSVADFELLIVDDGASSSAELSRPTDPSVIRKDPAGPAASRNEGMRAASASISSSLMTTTSSWLTVSPWGSRVSPEPRSPSVSPPLDQRARPWIGDVQRWLHASSRRRAADRRTPAGSPQLFPQVGQVTILAEVAPEFDERLRVEEDVDWWIAVSRIASPKVVEQPGYIRRIHGRPRGRSQEDLTRALEATELVLEKNACSLLITPAPPPQGGVASGSSTSGLVAGRRAKRSGLLLPSQESARTRRISLAPICPSPGKCVRGSETVSPGFPVGGSDPSSHAGVPSLGISIREIERSRRSRCIRNLIRRY